MLRTIGITVVGLVALLILGVLALPGYLERTTNIVVPHEPYAVSSRAMSLHNSLFIADLHADTLLWHRNPLAYADRGHVDVPRLVHGNVALQVFAAVTKSPSGQNYESNSAESDTITYLAMAQRWPMATWSSLAERALYQAQRLQQAEAEAPDQLNLILTVGDLQQVIEDREDGKTIVGGILATEGSHALDGDLTNIARLYEAGYRIMGLHHFFDNKLGGSLHGLSQGGLTSFGREAVERMITQGIIIDLAHSSQAVARDVLAMSDNPVIVSHTGLKGVCDTPRNFDDVLMQEIADGGGIIGVGYWDAAACDISPKGVVKAIEYGVDLVGADHIALGSDYDGATTVSFDTSEIAILTQEMLDANMSEETIAKVMGGNVLRFMLANLPQD